MSSPSTGEITALLAASREGNRAAANEVFAQAYQELRRLAHYYLQQERPHHTLQTTALVNELYLRIFGHEVGGWQDRDHFIHAAGRIIRHILADYARHRKPVDGLHQLSLDQVIELADKGNVDMAALDVALERLETIAPRASQIVEQRFFLGLTERETAEFLGISLATLKRDWEFARAWLFSQLSDPDKPPSA
jgi:RNA polymerase sigma factor (TIGR02999 family)